MKKSILYFIVPALIIVGSFALVSFKSSEPKFTESFVTVSVTEIFKEDLNSEILICYGDNHTESIKLEKYHNTNRISNLEKVTHTLNTLKQKGYKLVSCDIAVTDHHQKKFFVFEK